MVAKVIGWVSKLMALEVIVAGALAMVFPEQVKAAVPASTIPWLLGAVMFGMGLTLKGRDFALVAKRPLDVAIGIAAQFLLMPTIAWALSKAFGLEVGLAIGVILVGACPGGTASNVITYLAGGDVALSVTMTSCSTLLAPLVTPLAVLLLSGNGVDVNAPAMCLSVLEMVILPIALGVAANEFLPKLCDRIRFVMPAFSTLSVVVIVAAVVSVNAAAIKGNFGLIVLVVVLHNLVGMALGWCSALACGMDAFKRRTMAIEVGMQNSGLAASLAHIHFAAYPLAAVPGALFSVWHNLSGAVFAAVVNRRK